MDLPDILKLALTGRNIFLTGGAGVGKTFITNYLIENIKGKRITATATTGYAATHINGSTIHSVTGINTFWSPKHLNQVKANLKLRHFDNIKLTNILFIDEISMMSSYQFDLINEVTKFIRKSDKPFGGMQVIIVGDLFQAEPVIVAENSAELKKDGKHWVVNSDAYREANFKVIELTKVHRQDNMEFIKLLNEARRGELSNDSIFTLLDRQIGKTHNTVDLYATNAEVDNDNDNYLKTVIGKEELFDGSIWFDENLIDAANIKSHCRYMINSKPVKKELLLKPNAKVMIRDNNELEGYVNGSTGEYLYETVVFDLYIMKYNDLVSDLSETQLIEGEHYTVVENPNGLDTLIEVNPDQYELFSNVLMRNFGKYRTLITSTKLKIKLINGDIVYIPKKTYDFHFTQTYNDVTNRYVVDATYTQYPVHLAKSITAHKSQGCTMEEVFIDFKKFKNICGLGYVALSRSVSLDKLFLKNFSPDKIKADEHVKKFYDGLPKELN